MNYAECEKTIDLKQLLYYVLKRWKKIFIFLMIGALLGSGFSLLHGKKRWTICRLKTSKS